MFHLGSVHPVSSSHSGYSCRSNATSHHQSCRLGDPYLFAASHVFAFRVVWSLMLSFPLSNSCKPWQAALITLASGLVEISLFIGRCGTLLATFSSFSSHGFLQSRHVQASLNAPSLFVLWQLTFSSLDCRQSQPGFAFQSSLPPYVLWRSF